MSIVYNVFTDNLDYKGTGSGPSPPGDQASFYAYLSGDLSNATGDGTVVNPVPFDTTTTNDGAGFNTATGVFTAPVSGNYCFFSTLYLHTLTIANNVFGFSFIYNSGLPSSQTYTGTTINPGTMIIAGGGGTLIFPVASGVIPMNTGDTMQVYGTVQGSTKTVTISGFLGTSSFSGFLIT